MSSEAKDQAGGQANEGGNALEYRMAPGGPPGIDVKAVRSLAYLLYKVGRTEAANDLARKAVEIDPADPSSHQLLGDFLNTWVGDQTDAIAEYRRAVELAPDNIAARVKLSACLSGMGKAEEALAEAEEAVRRRPTDPRTHYHLAMALSVLGFKERAVRELRRVRELEPDYPDGRRRLANELREIGELKAAARIKLEGLELESKRLREFVENAPDSETAALSSRPTAEALIGSSVDSGGGLSRDELVKALVLEADDGWLWRIHHPDF